MKRLLLIAALAILAFPASAMAEATSHGVVLSVTSGRHTLQVVDPSHIVHSFRFDGARARLKPGTVISFRASGATISGVRVTGHVSKLSYYASVVRSSGRHLVLRLGDGRTVKFAASSAAGGPLPSGSSGREVLAHMASAPTVTINIQGLAPGATVLVTETIGGGSISISITLPTISTGSGSGGGAGSGSGGGAGSGSGGGAGSGSGGGSGSGAGGTIVQGTVTEVDAGTFDVQASGGSALVFHMNPSALANIDMSECDTVFVDYQPAGTELDAVNVDDYGTSDLGDCSATAGSSDEIGPITQISDSSITIDTADQGSLTFAVDPTTGLTAGFNVGDDVDVTYELDADGVTLDASDIEYAGTDEIGAVTAVSADSLTFTNGITGRSETFTADPSEAMFDGIEAGDEVDITFHLSSGLPVVDNVDDLTEDGTWTA
jgi:hypothetical protein